MDFLHFFLADGNPRCSAHGDLLNGPALQESKLLKKLPNMLDSLGSDIERLGGIWRHLETSGGRLDGLRGDCGRQEGIWKPVGQPWGRLGSDLGHLRGVWKPLGSLLGDLGGVLEASWERLGFLLGVFWRLGRVVTWRRLA